MWIALIIIGVIGVGLGGVLLFTAPARNELKNLPIAAMDFSILHDGTYVGEYDGGKSPMTVSYTHLDVYKRQKMEREKKRLRKKKMKR